MGCRAIHGCSVHSLVGAYLDLALAFLLLCASTVAFLASKFLTLFGLALPCSCAGRPGNRCLQRLLVDAPAAMIASVGMSVRTRFPFDSVWDDGLGINSCRRFEVEPLRGAEDDGGRRLQEMGGEESSGSASGAGHRPSNLSLGLRIPLPPSRDVKGKGVCQGQRPRSVLHLRRRRIAGKLPPSVSSSQPAPLLLWQGEGTSEFRCTAGQVPGVTPNDSPAPLSSGPCNIIDLDRGTSSPIGLTAQTQNCDAVQNAPLSDARGVHASEEDSADTIRNLQRALEDGRAAHVALCLELEKERSAAATAAEEAMAMILRLQKEKAAIEMEDWQYRRMIEEKSAYDEEEMGILKEIIVMREREKHALEKEVEAYRTMVFSGEGMLEQQTDDDLHDSVGLMGHSIGTSLGLSDIPVPMLQQTCELTGEKENEDREKERVANEPSYAAVFMDESFVYGDVKQSGAIQNQHLEPPDCGDQCKTHFQEKNMITTDIYTSSVQSQGSNYNKEAGKDINKIEVRVAFDDDDLHGGHGQDANQRGSDSSHIDVESSVLDVHVIDDKLNMRVGRNGKGDLSQVGCASDVSEKGCSSLESFGISNFEPPNNFSVVNWEGGEGSIHKTFLDITKRSLVMDCCEKALTSDSRRSSVSAVGSERFKLETEVEFLRERLKIIQDGRENLTFSMEPREKECFQLLLEKIACQLREIRKMTEPRKSEHRTSLPPPSIKVKSKKRRCHSVPRELHESM